MTREDALFFLNRFRRRGINEKLFDALGVAMEALENERPKGCWILSKSQNKEDTDNGNYRFECSNCGCFDTHSKATEVPYCWKCGADMRGENDE